MPLRKSSATALTRCASARSQREVDDSSEDRSLRATVGGTASCGKASVQPSLEQARRGAEMSRAPGRGTFDHSGRSDSLSPAPPEAPLLTARRGGRTRAREGLQWLACTARTRSL